jgi:hypothetical protein
LRSRSSAPLDESERSRTLMVGDGVVSAKDDYPSPDGGRVTMPNLSMPACLISAIVFITTP